MGWSLVLALVIVSNLAAFGMLRLAHARQVAATRQAVYVYSSVRSGEEEEAFALRDRTGVALLNLDSAEGSTRLAGMGAKTPLEMATLFLPSQAGWVPVSDEKTIDEALAPLQGVPTPHLRGAFAALAIGVLWLGFAAWRKSAAYLGALWPTLGILALGLGTPLCQGCLIGQDGIAPAATVLGLLGFGAAFLFLTAGRPSKAGSMALLALVAACAGVSQAFLVASQPKFCIPCLLAGAAWAGLFCVGTTSLAEARLKTILFARPAAIAAVIAAAALGIRHTQAAASVPSSRLEKDFRTAIGRPLSSYLGASAKPSPGLYVATLSQCGACELAIAALREQKVDFQTIPFCREASDSGCFNADFIQTSPLFLVVDSSGRIAYAEAGWSEDRFARERFFQRIHKWTSKTHEPSLENH